MECGVYGGHFSIRQPEHTYTSYLISKSFFSVESEIQICATEAKKELSENTSLTTTSNDIFFIVSKIEVLRVLL